MQLKPERRDMGNKITHSTGFGDDLERVAKKLGLDQLAMKVAHLVNAEDCGCEARRDKLNQLFPYKNNQQEDGSK
jgi:endonuclease IV